MLPGNGGVDGEKIVDGFARLEEVDEGLQGHSSICKAGCTVQDLFIDGHLRLPARFFASRSSRILIIGYPPPLGKPERVPLLG